MYGTMQAQLTDALDQIRAAGTLKVERPLGSAQSSVVSAGGADVLNFCA
ncbi:MAG: glycine C-acetyltransferase, partial [Demequina sp.]|nr:glycine C-acetyltransferase [Demequina sp.]